MPGSETPLPNASFGSTQNEDVGNAAGNPFAQHKPHGGNADAPAPVLDPYSQDNTYIYQMALAANARNPSIHIPPGAKSVVSVSSVNKGMNLTSAADENSAHPNAMANQQMQQLQGQGGRSRGRRGGLVSMNQVGGY